MGAVVPSAADNRTPFVGVGPNCVVLEVMKVVVSSAKTTPIVGVGPNWAVFEVFEVTEVTSIGESGTATLIMPLEVATQTVDNVVGTIAGCDTVILSKTEWISRFGVVIRTVDNVVGTSDG